MPTARKVDGWIGDVVGALLDPIIVMPGGWGDTLPDWLKNKVTVERLIENMQAIREGRDITATEAEAACYLYTASLAAPIGGDWTEIYMYLVGHLMEAKIQSQMPEDMHVESLTEIQWRDLKQLKSWIYDRRVKYRKEKDRGERQTERQEKKDAEARELETRPVQPSFF